MASNSSRFRCRLRNAAALFFTSRASRFERPDTSGGTKSLVVMRSLGRFAVTECGEGDVRCLTLASRPPLFPLSARVMQAEATVNGRGKSKTCG